jgi:CRP/FNR family transcriptional regulator, cyclic AMP receptor protein
LTQLAVVTEPGRPPAEVIQVLAEDPELAEALAADVREQATAALLARALELPVGPYRRGTVQIEEGGIGSLVLEGVMVQRVGIGDRYGAELVGEGDVLRSLLREDEAATLPLRVEWTVLEPTRVAILDERFVRQLALFPQVAGRLFARSVLRSRQLAVNMAIVHQARVDARLHLLFWHLAGRWGRVRSDGVLVPLRLTHAVLADLVAARRPTVTSALSQLAKEGRVRAVGDGWLLSGDPPGVGPGAQPPRQGPAGRQGSHNRS